MAGDRIDVLRQEVLEARCPRTPASAVPRRPGSRAGSEDRLGRPRATDEQIVAMTQAEGRLIYDFEIRKAYGQLAR